MSRNLATWWLQATAGVNYYRALMPAKHLPGRCNTLNPSDLQPPADGRNHVFPRQDGAAIWMFSGNTTRGLLMAEMKRQGIPVFMEVDDNYTVPPPIAHLGMSAWTTKIDRTGKDKHSYEAHTKLARKIDGVICSTPYLASVYERINPNVHVCWNSVDPDDWAPDPPHQRDGVLRVGWAGSWSHLYDVPDIRLALDWASRQKDVEVVLMGYDPKWGFEYRAVSWFENLADYRATACEIDVMLCPVRPSEWANCKSDVKALEAAMSGAAALVSRTEPYRPWWDGDAPGYSAGSPKEFLKVVKHLVRNRDEVAETAKLAREYVLAKRDICSTISQWHEALASVPDRSFPKVFA